MITIQKADGKKGMLNAAHVERADEGTGMVAIFTVSGTQVCVSDPVADVMAAIESNTGTLTEFAL